MRASPADPLGRGCGGEVVQSRYAQARRPARDLVFTNEKRGLVTAFLTFASRFASHATQLEGLLDPSNTHMRVPTFV
jgi:hypothetical protein